MAGEFLTMSAAELDRLETVRRVVEDQLSQVKAGELLGLTVRQVRRLCRAFERAGSESGAPTSRGTAGPASASWSRSMAATMSGSRTGRGSAAQGRAANQNDRVHRFAAPAGFPSTCSSSWNSWIFRYRLRSLMPSSAAALARCPPAEASTR